MRLLCEDLGNDKDFSSPYIIEFPRKLKDFVIQQHYGAGKNCDLCNWPRERICEGVEGKQKGQRAQKRQKVIFAFFALFAFFASSCPHCQANSRAIRGG